MSTIGPIAGPVSNSTTTPTVVWQQLVDFTLEAAGNLNISVTGDFGGLGSNDVWQIWVGGTSMNATDGTEIDSAASFGITPPGTGTFLGPVSGFTDPLPNPGGSQWVKLVSFRGVAPTHAVSFANFTIQIGPLSPPPTAAIDSPDDLSDIQSDTQIVFDVTASAGFGTAEATITDSVVTDESAWTLSGGFASGYYGINQSIADGHRIYLHRTSGWRTGALSVSASVTDSGANTATASRSFTVSARTGDAVARYITDPAQPFRPFYYLKITGLPYYFFSGIDPTDSKWGDAKWTLPTGYQSVKGMDTPSSTFDQALPDLIGGIATAERITLNMMDFQVVDANGSHSFFGRLLSPGRLTSNSSAILGTLDADFSAATSSGPMSVKGAGGAFSAQDTYVGGETVGVSSVSGPSSNVYTLTVSERNKYPCHSAYPPRGSYVVPLDDAGNTIPSQTVLVTQGDPLTFINRSAALYIGHLTPDGRPEPEAEALCRIVGHLKAINYGQNPGTFDFVVESLLSDIKDALIAPRLAHGDIAPMIYLGPQTWRTIVIAITGTRGASSDRQTTTFTIDDGSGNTYANILDVIHQFNEQFAAHGPIVLTIDGFTYDYAVSLFLGDGTDGKSYCGIRVDLPAPPVVPDSTVTVSFPAWSSAVTSGAPQGNSNAGLLSVLGFPPVPVVLAPGTDVAAGTNAVVTAGAPRSHAVVFFPTGSTDNGGVAVGLSNSSLSQPGSRFFTDQGDGSAVAYVRFGDGQVGQITDHNATTVTIGVAGSQALGRQPVNAADAGTFYYTEEGEAATVDQIIRIPSPVSGSAERGLFQFVASKGYSNDLEFNVFPEGIGLGLDGILDKDSIREAAFKFTTPFKVDIDATIKFSDLWTGLAKEQGLFLVWDPLTSEIALRVLKLANYTDAVTPNLTESNRSSTDDRSQVVVDTSNLRTGWIIKYGWDPIQKKFLSADLNVNDDFPILAYQISSRTETIEDRLIPLSESGFMTQSVVPALFDRSVFTRYPWMSVTRSMNKTGLLMSPGQYHKIADNTLINPFTGQLGIALTENVFGWIMRVQSRLADGSVTVTFLIDQTTDGTLLRPWSPTGLLNYSAPDNGYDNATGICSMDSWYTHGDHDGVDFQIGDKVALTTRDTRNADGSPLYYKTTTVSAVATDGTTVTVEAGLGSVSNLVETIMILQDWSAQTTDRKSDDHRTSFQGSGDTLLISSSVRMHKWT